MPGPGMDLIGEEEIQEVLEVLRGGYLFRYGISLGADVDPRFKGKVYQIEREIADRQPRRLRRPGRPTHERLDAAHEGAFRFERVLVVERDGLHGLAGCFLEWGIHVAVTLQLMLSEDRGGHAGNGTPSRSPSAISSCAILAFFGKVWSKA